MSFAWLPCLAVAGLILPVRLARADGIELVGVLRTPAECFVALQPASAGPPAWVKVGGHFGNCTVRELDPTRDVVVLVAGDARMELSLREPHVAGAAPSVETSAPEPAAPRTILRAMRAAYQRLYATGAPEAHGGELVSVARDDVDLSEYDNWCFGLTAAGELVMADPAGRLRSSDGAGPIHIVVAPETTLPQVAERLRYPLEALVRLNPRYADAKGGGPRTVRVH